MMFKWIWLSVAVILLDQLTKQLVAANFQLHESVAIIPMFNLTLAHNPGAAFGFLGQAGGWQRWFFALIAVAVSIGIAYWLKQMKQDKLWEAVGLALVLGGAVGNLVDRIIHGYVIDFLDVYYQVWHWPTFNVADIGISVGAVVLIIDALRSSNKT